MCPKSIPAHTISWNISRTTETVLAVFEPICTQGRDGEQEMQFLLFLPKRFLAFQTNGLYLDSPEEDLMMKILLCSFLVPFVLAAQGFDVGDTAPDFTLPYATRDSIARTPLHLGNEIGHSNIIVAFYPADWSPGCTKEVCSLRDNFAALQTLGAEVLAISGDYTWSHHEWAKYHNLPFRLLSDHNHQVATMYHSYDGSSWYNKRTVFIVDKHGKIAYMDLQYSVADLQDFERLKEAMSHLQ
jgi:peroxiredoxin